MIGQFGALGRAGFCVGTRGRGCTRHGWCGVLEGAVWGVASLENAVELGGAVDDKGLKSEVVGCLHACQ